MKSYLDRITIIENVCNGKPTIRGKRITVQSILEYLSAGDSAKDILNAFPTLEPEDITACLQFAAHLMDNNFTIKSVA